MEELMKTEWLEVINAKRNATYPEWKATPHVETEDTTWKVFDIVDTKDMGDPIVRPQNKGQATYFNGDENHSYTLRFIKTEEFMNQFRIQNPDTGVWMDWARNMSRPDYIVYDLSDDRTYFIIHELSSGSIQNKKAVAMKQLMNMVKMLDSAPKSKAYCHCFTNRLCYVSATGCVTASPCDMANGFMEAYNNLPDPLPLSNKSIENRGFKAFQSNVVKL